jgi:hypothetical protein
MHPSINNSFFILSVTLGRGMGSIFQFLDMNIILKFAISKGKVDFNFSITINNKEYRIGAFPVGLMIINLTFLDVSDDARA